MYILVYETIPPLVTTGYTIRAKVVVIVATYRRVVTYPKQNGAGLSPTGIICDHLTRFIK